MHRAGRKIENGFPLGRKIVEKKGIKIKIADI